MNWTKITWLAISLFVAQGLLGFAEGFLSRPSSDVFPLLAGHVASLVICAAIFALFANQLPSRTFSHAWLGLLLQVLIAVTFSAALTPWLGSVPGTFVVTELVVLVTALLVGTSLGISLRNRTGSPADA